MVAGGVACAIAMEVKTRPADSAKGERRTPSTPLRQRPSTGKLLELTPLWESIIKYNRFPQNVDKINVFTELAVRLNEPEWEVRQHALRVLADLIPVISRSFSPEDLDALMVPAVLSDVTHNLGHPAPAVRNSALDVLLAYLKHTSDPEFVLRSIVSYGLESPAAPGSLAATVVQVLPRLIDQTLSISHQSLVHLVTAVSKKLAHMPYQRQAIETLHRIKDHVGDSRFDHFLESYYPQVKRDLEVLHQVYQVEPNLRDSGIDLQSPPQTAQDNWSDSSMSPTQPKVEEEEVRPEGYDGAESDQDSDEDKPPAEDDQIFANNSAIIASRTETTVTVQEDFEDEEEDNSRKSPRRVRFGGEVVKLRTPDSDVTIDAQKNGSESGYSITSESPFSEDTKSEGEVISSFEVIPQKSPPRLRSSHIPVPINPVLSRPRRRSPDQFIPTYDGGDSVTSSSEGEQFMVRDFFVFQQQRGELANLSFLPSDLLQLLSKKDDWRTRVRGLDRLGSWVSSGRLTNEQGSHLLWYVIGCLSEEPRQARLIASLLRATRAVIGQSPGNLGSVLPWLVPGICRHLACGSPLPARLEAVEAIKTLMRISTPSAVINVIFSDRCIHSRSSKLRENSLLCLLYALMTFPSNEFDCIHLTGRIREIAVNEPKRRVRQAILETLAVLSQFVPRTALTIEADEYDNPDDALFFSDGLQARLGRRQLPTVSHEGLILYALQIPPMTGTDVDWVLAGIGSLSSGSARSRSQMDNQKSLLSQSSESMFSSWIKEPPNQKMMAVGVAMPQKSYDNLYINNHNNNNSNNYDERYYYNPSWSTDPRHNHPSNTQGFPHLNMSYTGRFASRNNNNSTTRNDLSHTWSGSKWTQQTEIPPHVSIKQSALNQSLHSGLPPISGPQVADWRNRKNNSDQINPGYRVYNQDEYKKGRWDRRQDNSSFRRPVMNRAVAPASPSQTVENNNFLRYNNWTVKPKLPAWFNKKEKVVDDKTSLSNSITLIKLPSPTESRSSYNVKENGFVRSPIINSEASRSDPSLATRSPQSSPVRSIHSSNLSSAKSLENGLAASSPSLGQVEVFENLPAGRTSQIGTPALNSINSSLASVISQPHLENGSVEQDFREGTPGRSSRMDRRGSDENAERPKTPAAAEKTDHNAERDDETSPENSEENIENGNSNSYTPNGQSVGTPNSDMSECSRTTEMTTKSTESLKSVTFEDGVKPRRRISRGPDIKKRSRTVGFEIKSSGDVSSLYPQSLAPFDNPRDAITKAVLQLENPEWFLRLSHINDFMPKLLVGLEGGFSKMIRIARRREVIMQGLQTVVRLVRHHRVDVQGGVTHSFVMPLSKHIRNLRSQVSRGACQCAGELFRTLGKHMDSEVEELAGSLLSRMADTNKFLKADSCAALEAMVDHTSPSKSVAALVSKGAKHQNAVVRGATCRLLLRLCNRLGPDRTLALPKDTRDAILLTGAKFLTEGSLETRKYAKEMFALLSTSHKLNGILADVIPHNIMRNIQKVLARITA